jgi:hypothetical protein
MEDKPKRAGFGSLQLPAIDAKLKPGSPALELGPLDELVTFTVRLPREYILWFKKAHKSVPAFSEQAFIQAAIREHRKTLESQIRDLSELEMQELLQRYRALQKKA